MKSTLIISDSHGDSARVMDIIEYQNVNIDSVIFLGDGATEIQEIARIFDQYQFYAVAGNNDHLLSSNIIHFPLERVAMIQGFKVYMTHGHVTTYSEIEWLLFKKCREIGAEIGLYGHTHKTALAQTDGIIVANPGSVSYPRGNSVASYALLANREGKAEIAFYHAQAHHKLCIVKSV